MSEQKIEVGQVWRERDSRFERYTQVLKVEGEFACCRRCSQQGKVYPGYPRTRIRLENLARRFMLVSPREGTS